MGWFNEQAPRHAGYMVGIRAITTEGGSIGFRSLRDEDDDGRTEIPLRIVQVGCDCGWRSQRLRAPLGTTWSGFVMLPRVEQERETAIGSLLGRKPFETICRERWRERMRSLRPSLVRDPR
jgi:hypothetical protein